MSEAAYNPDHPENMPELIREVTMISGALQGVSRRWEELLQQVGPIRLQRPEAVESDRPMSDSFAVYSPLGKQLREIYDEVSRMESRISALAGELAL